MGCLALDSEIHLGRLLGLKRQRSGAASRSILKFIFEGCLVPGMKGSLAVHNYTLYEGALELVVLDMMTNPGQCSLQMAVRSETSCVTALKYAVNVVKDRLLEAA